MLLVWVRAALSRKNIKRIIFSSIRWRYFCCMTTSENEEQAEFHWLDSWVRIMN